MRYPSRAIHKGYDVPNRSENRTFDEEYKYTPFTLCNMPDEVKDAYIAYIYAKKQYKRRMVVKQKGNLRWVVVECVVSRSDVVGAFGRQFRQWEEFLEDAIV